MNPQNRTLRKVAAVMFSFFLNGGLFLLSMAKQKPGKDESLEAVIAFTLSVIGSSLILQRTRTDRFWKVVLFSCAAGFAPMYLLLALVGIRYGFGGTFPLAFTVVTVLMLFSALCALPFVGLFYWYRGRSLDSQETLPYREF